MPRLMSSRGRQPRGLRSTASMGFVPQSVELPNNVSIPFVEQGDTSGLPMVLLHGFADSWRSFELVLPHLPEFIHAFALTQRGHGDASRPATGYGLLNF